VPIHLRPRGSRPPVYGRLAHHVLAHRGLRRQANARVEDNDFAPAAPEHWRQHLPDDIGHTKVVRYCRSMSSPRALFRRPREMTPAAIQFERDLPHVDVLLTLATEWYGS
jgi:hypothetical protein